MKVTCFNIHMINEQWELEYELVHYKRVNLTLITCKAAKWFSAMSLC